MISVTENDNNSANIFLDGDLTIYVAEKFHQEMTGCLEKYQSINIDMSNVSEMDTSCYQILLRAKLISNRNNKKFTIDKQGEAAQQVFDLYNLNSVFEDQHG